jgi:peptide/nickel transport system substrate-binding protein
MAAQQIPAFGDLYDAGRRGFAFDPDLARRLLREAGYAGQEMTLRIPGRYYLNLMEAAQIIEAMWREVGVNVRLEVIENIAQLTNPGADIRPTSIAFRFPDPLGGGLGVHWARGFFIQDRGFWTPVRYNEILAALRAATEPAERRRLWIALMDEWDAEAPGVLLYAPQEIIGKRRAIRWRHPPLYYMDFRPDSLGFGA